MQASDKIFHTYNNKKLSVVTGGFKTQDNFDENRVVRILFEETFFIDESNFINVSVVLLVWVLFLVLLYCAYETTINLFVFIIQLQILSSLIYCFSNKPQAQVYMSDATFF